METAQRDYLSWLSRGKSEEDKAAARAADQASHAELKNLARRADNATCADCTAQRPGWAVLPHGVFVCIDCAQLHRHIGRHISQVKAFNTGTYLWFEPELAVMRVAGNAPASAALCGAPHAPTKPNADASPESKLAYVRGKYADRSWVAAPRSGSGADGTSAAVGTPCAAPRAEARPPPTRAPIRLPTAAAPAQAQDLLSAPLSAVAVPVLPFSAPSKPTTPASAPSSDAYGAKKDAILAQFQNGTQPPPHLLGAAPPNAAAMWGSASGGGNLSLSMHRANDDAFFAAYGIA